MDAQQITQNSPVPYQQQIRDSRLQLLDRLAAEPAARLGRPKGSKDVSPRKRRGPKVL